MSRPSASGRGWLWSAGAMAAFAFAVSVVVSADPSPYVVDTDGDGVCATTRGPDIPWRESLIYVLIPSKFDNGVARPRRANDSSSVEPEA